MPSLAPRPHSWTVPERRSNLRPVHTLSLCKRPKFDSRAVFSQASDLVEAAKSGVSACILAYGATGSGKTHTLHGTPSAPGLVPLAIDALFSDADDGFTYRLTCVELYNDRVSPENFEPRSFPCAAEKPAIESHGRQVADLLAPVKKHPLPCEVDAAKKGEQGSIEPRDLCRG